MVKKKRRINRDFNAFIASRATDIKRGEGECRTRRNWLWIGKGAPK